jgi:uncharacterized membrane protein
MITLASTALPITATAVVVLVASLILTIGWFLLVFR